MVERKEDLKQEIRFLFQGRNVSQVWNILIECFEEVCIEFGEEESLPNINYTLNLLEMPLSYIMKRYKLKIKGKVALCPFHKDTKPSLSFNDEKGLWKCFGCGAKGNALSFIKKMEVLRENEKKCDKKMERD